MVKILVYAELEILDASGLNFFDVYNVSLPHSPRVSRIFTPLTYHITLVHHVPTIEAHIGYIYKTLRLGSRW